MPGDAETWAMVGAMVAGCAVLAFLSDPKARRWDGYLAGLAMFVGIAAALGFVLWKFA